MLHRRFAELGDGQSQGRRRLLTVMGNISALAVASLADTACIILTENAWLDEDAKRKADQQGICVLGAEENSYRLALQIGRLLS